MCEVKGKWNDIHDTAILGDGTVLWSWNYIGANARLGRKCKVSNHVHIGDGCIIGDECNFQPYVILNSNTKVGNRCHFGPHVVFTDEIYPMVGPKARFPVQVADDVVLGAGCIVRGNVKIGRGAVIGMGAVVVQDVLEECVVAGVPATPLLKRDGSPMTRTDYEIRKREVESKLGGD